MFNWIIKVAWIICIVLVTLLYFWFIWESDIKKLIDNSSTKVKEFVKSDEFKNLSTKLWNELKISANELKEATLTEENKKKALEVIKKEAWITDNKEAEVILKAITEKK